MKGLILKDLYYMKNNFKLLAVVFLLYGIMFINQKSFMFFPAVMTMLIGFMTLGIITVDEKNNWDKYALTMPLSRKNLVQEKFVFINGLCSLTFLVTFGVSIIILKKFEINLLIESILFLLAVLVFLNLNIFIGIKFGAEKAMIYVFGIIAGIAVIVFGIQKIFPEIINKSVELIPKLNMTMVGIVFALIAVLLISLFYLLSIKTINKKEY
ncbi:ABC-2 transporter permease [Miniphocaeibacter halophilus]|uniref:ABC-2 transporter permease n=1 Tax=Miniphocaeibacter halophilus TaxID=2931922 RepID=A0AC61N0F6_9FIRM|nr:ABC-2 transporter permease [Miniphocaeibacter halophilus]QQK08501.1 ABC-2 transporter permease [Miniphocaeibacter halophilus]